MFSFSFVIFVTRIDYEYYESSCSLFLSIIFSNKYLSPSSIVNLGKHFLRFLIPESGIDITFLPSILYSKLSSSDGSAMAILYTSVAFN